MWLREYSFVEQQSTKLNSVWFVLLPEARAAAMIIAINNNFDQLKQFSRKIGGNAGHHYKGLNGYNCIWNCSDPLDLQGAKVTTSHTHILRPKKVFGYFPFCIFHSVIAFVKIKCDWIERTSGVISHYVNVFLEEISLTVTQISDA